MVMNNEIVTCFEVNATYMNFHRSNENTSVKMIILSVIRTYLLLTVCVENTAVKFVMR